MPALGTRGQIEEMAQRHRERGQGRSGRHLDGDDLCHCGSPTAGPLATLSNEPSATTVVVMEHCSLPSSHMGHITPQGQCQHRDNTSVGQRDLGMVAGGGCNLPDCRLG